MSIFSPNFKIEFKSKKLNRYLLVSEFFSLPSQLSRKSGEEKSNKNYKLGNEKSNNELKKHTKNLRNEITEYEKSQNEDFAYLKTEVVQKTTR